MCSVGIQVTHLPGHIKHGSCAAVALPPRQVMLYDDEEGDCITPEDVFERLEDDLGVAGAVLWVGISFEQSASTEYFRKVGIAWYGVAFSSLRTLRGAHMITMSTEMDWFGSFRCGSVPTPKDYTFGDLCWVWVGCCGTPCHALISCCDQMVASCPPSP